MAKMQWGSEYIPDGQPDAAPSSAYDSGWNSQEDEDNFNSMVPQDPGVIGTPDPWQSGTPNIPGVYSARFGLNTTNPLRFSSSQNAVDPMTRLLRQLEDERMQMLLRLAPYARRF